MADADETKTARRALGRRLAQLRRAGGHTQHEFARLVQYGRSSVANTETGHQHPDRAFWSRCDTVLQTGGALVAEYDRITELDRRQRRASAMHESRATSGPVAPASHTSRGAPGADDDAALWEREDTIDARRLALKSSTDDDARLAYVEAEVRQAIADNERLTPAALMACMRPLRTYVDQLMGGRQHPPQRARLYTAAAHLSGLLGALALDLGAFGVAHAYGAEAFDLAEAAQQPDAQAWARATQSLIAFYSGDYHDALAYAQDGLRHGGTSEHRIRLTINGQARALARLGDQYGVDRAVDRAFTMLSDYPAGTAVSASLTLGPYCPARTAANAATAYLALGRTAGVTSHLATAITAFDTAGLAGPQALSRLDLATAHLHANNPDPEQAAMLAEEALTLTADQRFESVHQRTRQFLTTAQPFTRHPRLRHVADLLADRTQVGATAQPALPSLS
ncbi:helix-turn-helix domain-containing protein [Micromonospora endolithica]|uniref:XRE family transcriptional regulator n=1 Tax=Micromonospora endolithica TaxID=230091 RepID=A0A3A9ZSI6_9ACTN|nr:helix-turn-helix transcriptional regulator [Micromonospora endolithica]RKN50427.1 XRE family transcriptional regulator [Micromonospora endolithica]TWJ20886.1 helix-turn-helix protein [Micromonospora endolithica]